MTVHYRHLLLALFGVALAACSTSDTNLRAPEEKTQQQAHETLHRKVALYLEKKQYRQALEVMTRRREVNQPPLGMENEFAAAINGIMECGEQAMARKEYLAAGQIFRLVITSYPKEKSVQKKIRLGARRVKIHLESCSGILMEQGLQEYRRGELDRASKTWKSILSFDPGNREARKAIETATIQKRSLQVLEE